MGMITADILNTVQGGYSINTSIPGLNMRGPDMAYINFAFSVWEQSRAGAVYLIINDILKKYSADQVAWAEDKFILTEPTGTNIIPYSTDVSQWTGSGGATESAGVWTIPVSGEVRMGTGLTITAELWTAWLDIVAISGALVLRVNDGTGNTDVALTATGITENMSVLAAGSGYVAIRNDGVGTQTIAVGHSQFEKGTRSSHIPTDGAPASHAATTQTRRELTSNEFGLLRGVAAGVELWDTQQDWDVSGSGTVIDGDTVELSSQSETETKTGVGLLGDMMWLDVAVVGSATVQGRAGFGSAYKDLPTGRSVLIQKWTGDGRVQFRSNSTGVSTVTVHSVQKLDPIRTQVSSGIINAAAWNTILAANETTGVLSTIAGIDSILGLKNDAGTGGKLESYDGTNVAEFDLDWAANTEYDVTVRYGDKDDMLNPNLSPATGLDPNFRYFQIIVNGVAGPWEVFTGNIPVDVDIDGKAWMYLAYGIPAFSMEIEPPTMEALT